MKFVLLQAVLFWWPVNVRIPSEEAPGTFVDQALVVQFAAQSLDEAEAAQEEAGTLQTQADLVRFECAQLRRVVRGWRGVVTPDGSEVPYSPEALEQALQLGWFRRALFAAYGQCINGQEARLGN